MHQHYQPPRPPRRHRRWPYVIIGAVFAVVVVAALATNGGRSPAPSVSVVPALPTLPTVVEATSAGTDTVVYTITGRSAQLIDYTQPGSAQQSQITDETRLPWSRTFQVAAGTPTLMDAVTAQNAGSGTIGCSITVNGVVVARNTSSGQYAVVECSPSS